MKSRSVEITLVGDVRGPLEAEFDDLAVTVDLGVTRVLVDVRDASALYGILDRLEALGLELLSVHHLTTSEAASPGSLHQAGGTTAL